MLEHYALTISETPVRCRFDLESTLICILILCTFVPSLIDVTVSVPTPIEPSLETDLVTKIVLKKSEIELFL